MLKTTVLLQVFFVDEILVANEVSGIEDNDKLIEKYRKLLKTRKLSKSKNPYPTDATEKCNFFHF